MWENACYLLPDARRLEVFEALQEQVRLNAAAIERAPDAVLLALARRGGMRPEMRVFRWREIARITLNQFGGDLSVILRSPYVEAKRALKQFPNIGDPGAEKILMFCGLGKVLPLESNGLRVLVRVGWGPLLKDYGRMYRAVQNNLTPVLPNEAGDLKEAFLLLREHGRVLCKDSIPICHLCPLADLRPCSAPPNEAKSTEETRQTQPLTVPFRRKSSRKKNQVIGIGWLASRPAKRSHGGVSDIPEQEWKIEIFHSPMLRRFSTLTGSYVPPRAPAQF
jgi:endonuclease-3